MLVVRDREAGNIIEEVKTVEEGLMLIKEYEDQDRADGTYEANFYEVANVPDGRVKYLRSLTGLSQTKFGELYGIPMRTIQNWENGVNEAPEYVIRLLERVVKEDFKTK